MALSDLLAILGLAGAAIGFIDSRRARMKAAKSEKIANDAMADAAAARLDLRERVARAVETIAARESESDTDFARVFEDALNAKAAWTIEERGDANSFRLRNTGNVRAEDVQISAVPIEHTALFEEGDLGDLDAGQAAAFSTSSRLSPTLRRIAVSWVEGDTRQPSSIELNLR